MRSGHLYFVFFLLLFSSCENKEDIASKPPVKLVAKAGNEGLDLEEYSKQFLSSGNVKDSLAYAKKIIENWASDALLYEEALLRLNDDEIQIEKEVQAYKKSLVNHIYQSKIVEANLDTVIDESEIREYYDSHHDNFVLRDNIVKVDYIKIPVQAVDLVKIKKLLYSNLPKDKEQLKELCVENAENFFMNDSTWLYTADVRKEIPKLNDETDFSLYTGKVVQFEDEFYYYYLKIKDVKIKNGLSPLLFERTNIKKYILLNRRTQLLNEYKLHLLEEAKLKKKFILLDMKNLN